MTSEKLDNLDSVSKRLKYLVDTMGVKQSHMAEKLGLSPSGLHYILNNDVKFSKNAKKIAEYLNVNETWLATGQGEIHQENTSIKTYRVPLYYPDQLRMYYQSNEKKSLTTNNFIITSQVYENNSISIYVTSHEWAPKFEVGDMIIFEQLLHFNDGEIILAYTRPANEILIRFAHKMNDHLILSSPLNHPNKLKLHDEVMIIGVYRECWKRSRNG
ncbi:MAG: helix-turn-helix transcriptional regulator [Legionellales bacterium]|nr:helix-turn-helix transcriptional regulator [Legionellales bacterium]